jgi:hypothetical protein
LIKVRLPVSVASAVLYFHRTLLTLTQQRSMLAELSARLMDSRAAAGNIDLRTQVEEGAGPDDGPVRLAIGDDCKVM